MNAPSPDDYQVALIESTISRLTARRDRANMQLSEAYKRLAKAQERAKRPRCDKCLTAAEFVLIATDDVQRKSCSPHLSDLVLECRPTTSDPTVTIKSIKEYTE